ncbi:hypothetical protein [Hyalangium gracile]|uniref:hypothetical protein n=1 Tax=Hyalangium gracile TaxID=394092 RepID=UPI001CCC41BA|nr:hypothetical protein [Hyalangium gracile]
MTAIIYSDRAATSPHGRFLLEARSPHNGTIPDQEGRWATESDFSFRYRQHQRNFRYRLLEPSPGSVEPRVIWTRWQGEEEDSPNELVVSDAGWSALRTHGFRPEVIVVSPSGQDVARVRILDTRGRLEDDEDDEKPKPREGRQLEWRVRHLVLSTGGTFWANHSWPYFFEHDATAFFVWRTYSGQRLLLDLTHATLIPEGDPAWATLERSMIDAERRSAYELLASLSTRMDEVQKLLAPRDSEEEEQSPLPLREELGRVVAALHLVGVHRIQEGLPFLRQWEAIDCPLYSTGSNAFGDRISAWMQVQNFRPIAQHSLRLLGERPQGYAAYHFLIRGQGRFPVPELISDRRQRAAELDSNMSAEQVLRLLGSPDHIRRRSRPVGKLHRSSEEWEYDFQDGEHWLTLRITWEEHRRQGRITSIEEVPADWLRTDERVLELLGH